MDDIYDYLATLILEFKPKLTGVFDIGAGQGTLGLYLREYEFSGDYLGVDKDPAMCVAMEKQGLDCEEGDLKWLDFRKNSWSVVVAKDVLEQLDSPSMLTNAILIANRYFILVTEALLVDSLSPTLPERHFCIDDLLRIAKVCKFHLKDYHKLGTHSVLVFMRKKGRHK